MNPTPLPTDPIDEEIRRRFEEAWIRGEPRPIEDFIPEPDREEFPATLEELVHIELEFAWKSWAESAPGPTERGSTPSRVEDYVARFPILDSPPIVERLAQQEYDVRHRFADPPPIDEFEDRFPGVRFEPPPARDSDASPGGRRLPKRIARYEIVRFLGEGGMGVVYLARQDKPRRTVALKVIKPGYLTPEVLKRFEHEAQILGFLQHPSIAQVHEAGIDEGEHGPIPFIAMEFVSGEPLGDYCKHHDLSIDERLDLIVKICDAVQHAHQKGIVHRDLKPGNILIERADGIGRPKILDFGVARVTDSDLQTTTLQTDVGQLLGTVQYMSPEQAAGDPTELDMRSDVYSLGVILYELLTGKAPYDLRGMLIHEAVRRIREHEPAPAGSVNHTIRGDLTTILSKAMEKEKNRRYQSAAEFSDDVRRFMNSEPITAHPPSAIYQLRKFARRHRLLVGSMAAVAAALLIGTGLALWQAVRATNALAEVEVQRDEALRQARIAESITEFLNDNLLSAPNPGNPIEGASVNRDIPVLKLVELAARNIEGKFPDEPLIEAAIRNTLGFTFKSLGEYDRAEEQYNAALALELDEVGGDHAQTLKTRHHLAVLFGVLGRYEEAEKLQTKVIEAKSRILGSEHRATLISMANLASVYSETGRIDEALALQENVIAAQEQTLGDEHLDTLISKNNLAGYLDTLGRDEEAERLYLEVLDAQLRLFGEEFMDTLTTMGNLAQFYAESGRLGQAEPLLARTTEICARVLGDTHPSTLHETHSLAMVLAATGRQHQAIPLLTETLDHQERVLGGEHPSTLYTAIDLASIHCQTGNLLLSEALFAKCLEPGRRILGEDHSQVLQGMAALAALYQMQERYDEAIRLFEKTIEIQRRVLGDENELTIISESNLGEIFMNLRRDDEAEALLASAASKAQRTLLPGNPFLPVALFRYGLCLYFLGRHTEAAQRLLAAHEAAAARKGSPVDGLTVQIIQVLIRVHEATGQVESAAEWRAKLPEGK